MLGWEFPPFISGGLGTHCCGLTEALAKKGILIDFYMPKVHGNIGETHINIIQTEYTEIMPYPTAEEKGHDFYHSVVRYNEACAEKASRNAKENKYDIIHAHDWLNVIAGIKLKYFLSKPLVLTVHSTEYDRTANLSPWQKIVDIEKEGIKHADRIIAVSRRTKNQLVEKYGADKTKIAVIYNAVDSTKFRDLKHVEWDEKIVTFFGRLTVQKGPDFFIKAAKTVLERYKNVRFIIAGTGDMLPQLIRLALGLGIIDRITFTGYLPDEDLPKLYSISDVFVLPSVSEPFGIAPLEAMAAGVPVIISKTSGAGEIIRNCLKVDFWDVDDMSDKILALLRYETLYKTIRAEEMKEIADAKFSWERAGEETINVYKELI